MAGVVDGYLFRKKLVRKRRRMDEKLGLERKVMLKQCTKQTKKYEYG